jgi:hypothetical protein
MVRKLILASLLMAGAAAVTATPAFANGFASWSGPRGGGSASWSGAHYGSYGRSGCCYGGGIAAGAVAGLAVGTAVGVAAASRAPYPVAPVVVYAPPPVVYAAPPVVYAPGGYYVR